MLQPKIQFGKRSAIALAITLSLGSFADLAMADARSQAHRVFSRLAGVPPTAAQLDELEALIKAGNVAGAAKIATDTNQFLEVTVRDFLATFINVDQSPRNDYNDFIATGVGMTRDSVPFDQILYADIVYTAPVAPVTPPVTAYAINNNLHYTSLEAHPRGVTALLTRRTQTEVSPGIAPAGAFSLRSWGEAYYSAGTNRRSFRFSMMNFMCRDLESMSDVTRSDARIRRDITRTPGGEGAVFKQKCSGCHTGMDPFSGAFAYYNFETDRLVYTAGVVQEKFNVNPGEFPEGYVTIDDSWLNNWAVGNNASIGWPADKMSGNGAASFGQMLAATQEFPKCMAKKVFTKVCMKEAVTPADKAGVEKIAAAFAAEKKFNMKELFAGAAGLCLGE